MISGLIATALIGQQPQRTTSLTGNIERIENFESKILGNRRNITVYMPPNYETSPKMKFSVLYMHDGQNVFDGMTSYIPNQEWRADEAAEALINAGMIEPIIIVGIDNAGADRGNEYLPTEITMGSNKMGGRADKYGEMLTSEIMPLINQRYRTKIGAANTGLVGSSFGGVITSYLGMKHSNVFGKLGVISPSVWVDNRVLLKMVSEQPKNQKRAKIWIDMGGKEGANSVTDAQDLLKAYQTAGWKSSDLRLVIEPGAEHNELAWSRRMMSILTYLFPSKKY